jgi:hypothetical protein
VPSSLSESENKLINLDIFSVEETHQEAEQKGQDSQHNTPRKKHDLLGLGLDPRIVVKTGEY